MLKVLVADSHPIARVGIKCLLLQLSREVALVEARTPRESLGRFRERGFDVVILDVSIPGEGESAPATAAGETAGGGAGDRLEGAGAPVQAVPLPDGAG